MFEQENQYLTMPIRIIGGKLKGKRLFGVKDDRVRPTTDRHRESIFNILSSQIVDAKILDLFAGTGAMGLEALSRGAEQSVFVDISRNCCDVISRNVQSCHLDNVSEIIRCDILKSLNHINHKRFDLVFMDPPYDHNAVMPALQNLYKTRCLNAGAVVVIEHVADDFFATILPRYYSLCDQRKFGKTIVSFLKFMI